SDLGGPDRGDRAGCGAREPAPAARAGGRGPLEHRRFPFPRRPLDRVGALLPPPLCPGMTPMDDRDRLKRLLIERSVRLGDFTLASGAKSDYYVDARRTTMSAEGQMLVGRVALAALRDSGLSFTHVGGLTMGADPIAYA